MPALTKQMQISEKFEISCIKQWWPRPSPLNEESRPTYQTKKLHLAVASNFRNGHSSAESSPKPKILIRPPTKAMLIAKLIPHPLRRRRNPKHQWDQIGNSSKERDRTNNVRSRIERISGCSGWRMLTRLERRINDSRRDVYGVGVYDFRS